MLTIGTKIHNFTVIANVANRHGKVHYLCRCGCGTEKIVQASKLMAGRWRSCGCVGAIRKGQRNRHDELLPEQVFGLLTLVCRLPQGGPAEWLCQCNCSELLTVRAAALNDGVKESCGCRRTAGGWGRMRGLWRCMIDRCENEANQQWCNYGGRGIRVCEEWRESLSQFLADVGPRPSGGHSLDRIDVNGHYEPGNVRWATTAEQGRNRRNNHLVTVGSRTQCVAAWAADLGCHNTVIYNRIKAGWPEDVAVTTPVLSPLKSLLSGPAPGRQTVIASGDCSMPLVDWAIRLGCSSSTIINRIKSGWPPEVAVTAPLRAWGVGREAERN